jgi:dGTPase
LFPEAKGCRRALPGQLSLEYYDRFRVCGRTCRENSCMHGSCSEAWSFEALAVQKADDIAQRHHDIEDGLAGGVLRRSRVVELLESHFGSLLTNSEADLFQKTKDAVRRDSFVPWVSRFLVGFLKARLVDAVSRKLEGLNVKTHEEFEEAYNHGLSAKKARDVFDYDEELSGAHGALEDDLKTDVLNSFAVQRMDGAASHVIRKLFKAYFTNPQQLPDRTIWHVVRDWKRELGEDVPLTYTHDLRRAVRTQLQDGDERFILTLARTICNHIACMTDDYALTDFRQMYGHAEPTDHMRPFA